MSFRTQEVLRAEKLALASVLENIIEIREEFGEVYSLLEPVCESLGFTEQLIKLKELNRKKIACG